MRKLLALLIVLALAALGVWFFVGRDDAAPAVVDGVRARAESVPAPVESAPLEQQADDSVREAPARIQAPAPLADAPVVSTPTEHLAELKGRCLLPGGSPAVGASIQVHGWQANQERVIRHGLPEQWQDPSATTGPDGRFSIRFDPPLAYQFVLDAKTPGHAKASWRWSEIKPDEVKDLGDIELPRGGTITGRIVAANGKVQKEGWSVHAENAVVAREFGRGGGRDATRSQAGVDPVTGEFRIEDLPPGSIKVKAYSRIANWIDGPVVDVRAGEVVEAPIRYDGPDNSARIVVITFSRPFHVFSHDFQELVLRGPGIEPRRAAKIAGSSQSFSFDDLPPGRYTVEVNDPKFLPWSKDGVEPGTSVDAKLKGNAAVRLEIVDAQTSEPVAASLVRVRFERVNFSPREFMILERGATPPAGGLYDGLIPVDQTLIVSAEGYADCELALPDLRAGETRPLRAAMTRGSRIAGRVVVGEERSPAADVDVVLEAVGAESLGQGRFAPSSRITADLQRGNHVRTDASGRFAFTMVPLGKHSLRASYSASLTADVEVDVSDGSDKTDLVLALPACSYLAGRLIAPEGASFEGLSLVAFPSGSQAQQGRPETRWSEQKAEPIAADGSFRAGPLAVGEVQVSLRLPNVMLPQGFNSSGGTQPMPVELGRVTIEGGHDTVHDFDARAVFPGRIAVELRVNGAAAPGVVTEVRGRDGAQYPQGVAIAGTDGKSTTNPVPCGTYRLLARTVDSAWFYLAPAAVTVKPGEVASASIDVPLVEGVLQMLDDNKMEARVTRKVAIRRDGGNASAPVGSAQLSTDSDGRLALRLPPGSYRLYSGEGFLQRDAKSVGFDMTPSGPVPASVEWPR